MGTVEDDQFGYHLRVVNGEQPSYGPAPVMAHQAASVVTLEEKGNDYDAGAVLFLNVSAFSSPTAE